MTTDIYVPFRKRGAQSKESILQYEINKQQFCTDIQKLGTDIGFSVSSRGWGYILEEFGITKDQFGKVADLINDCRKEGLLPIHFCSDDESRAINVFEVQATWMSIDEYSLDAIQYALDTDDYYPQSFWESSDYYIEMFVEKKDLIGLFKPICSKYFIPLSNFKGWSDINSRAYVMERFKRYEDQGKQCVLLYCGDHDPGGLRIADNIRKNLNDLSPAVGWNTDNLIIDHFGLHYDFIQENNITWVDNLISGSGKDLAKKKDEYIQDYIQKFGVRKVEANALLSRIDEGRKLCTQTIEKYLSIEDANAHRLYISDQNESVRDRIRDILDNELDDHFPK